MISTDVISRCKETIDESDALLIGAGAGLSTAAGLEYGGKRFTDNFTDYIERYGLTDMYTSVFYPYPTKEGKWGYFSRHTKLNYYDFGAAKLYKDLLDLLRNKNYFVITTNGDGLFFKAGFDPERIFATQGDYSKFQCSKGCHDTLYDNEEAIKKMVEQQKDCRIPTELLPVCPVCGEDMAGHLRIDEHFVENEDWTTQARRYQDFVQNSVDSKLVMLELGVGFNTPSIIRWPFEQLAVQLPQSRLIRINKDDLRTRYDLPEDNILINDDIAPFIENIRG